MAFRGFFNQALGQAATFVNQTIANSTQSHFLGSEISVANIFSVKEISRSQAADIPKYPILQRSENSLLILYGPIDKKLSPCSHVIILHEPETVVGRQSQRMFSIYRSNDELQATTCFIQFKETLPILVAIDPLVICEKNMLDKLCLSLRENTGWSAVHLTAAHNFSSYFSRPIMKEYLNLQSNMRLQTPIHIAVEYKNTEAVKALLDLGVNLDLVDERENTILHIGADKNVTILNILLREVAIRSPLLLEMRNKDNCTPLHLACRSNSPECVKALLAAGADVNVPFKDSYPIHMAVNSRSACCVKEIVSRNPEQLQLKDLADGGTPLHWAHGPEIIGILLELGCDPSILDNNGKSALHQAIKRGELKSVILLLCHHAPIEIQDEDGNTPLHIACELQFKNRDVCLTIIKALIVFGANLNVLNKKGETPRHVCCTVPNVVQEFKDAALFYLAKVGAKRCPTGQQQQSSSSPSSSSSPGNSQNEMLVLRPCTRGCAKDGTFDGNPPDLFPALDNSNLMDECLAAFSINTEMRHANSIPIGLNDNENTLMDTQPTTTSTTSNRSRRTSPDLESSIGGRVLCLDGGGIRGLVLTQTLLVIQEILGHPINDMFDWIAGTSTGGILGLGLACGKSVLELQALYLRLKDKVFTGGRPYSSQTMEDFLKKEFGESSTMGSITHPRVMITTAIVDTRPAEFHFFRNYLSPQCILNQFQNYTRNTNNGNKNKSPNGRNSGENAMEVDIGETEDEKDLKKFVWQVAKWTGAAPSFFQVDGRYIDGGLVSNNPTLDALTELFQFSASMRAVGDFKIPGMDMGSSSVKIPSVVVSLGCGVQPKEEVNTTHLDIAWPKGVMDALSAIPRLQTMVNLLVDQATQAEGHVVERSRAWCSSIGVPFFRFSPPCPVFVDLDETQDDVLIDLMWITRAYTLAQESKLEELRQVLIRKAPTGRQQQQQQ